MVSLGVSIVSLVSFRRFGVSGFSTLHKDHRC